MGKSFKLKPCRKMGTGKTDGHKNCRITFCDRRTKIGKIIKPTETREKTIPPNVLELAKRIHERKHPRKTLLALCVFIKKSREQNADTV